MENNNLPTSTNDKNELTQLQSLRATLNSQGVKSRFEEMLGKRSASFLSSIISSVSNNKMLASSEPSSVVAAAAVAASLDLPINSSLGFAHIVPYKPKNSRFPVAQFQLGWKGFIQLALRSGQYETINVTPILEGQITKHDKFTGEMEFSSEYTSKKIVGYLLFFKLINGYRKYFYMTHEECESHGKKYSQSFKKGYGLWVDNFEAMALKTVVKLGLSKYGILSVEMQKAIEVDQAVIKEDGSSFYVDNESASELEDERQEREATPTLDEKLKIAAEKKSDEINKVVEAKETLKPKEKSTMQAMAGQMRVSVPTEFKGMKINEIEEETLYNLLAELDEQQSAPSEDLKVFYSNACVWLGRKIGVKYAN